MSGRRKSNNPRMHHWPKSRLTDRQTDRSVSLTKKNQRTKKTKKTSIIRYAINRDQSKFSSRAWLRISPFRRNAVRVTKPHLCKHFCPPGCKTYRPRVFMRHKPAFAHRKLGRYARMRTHSDNFEITFTLGRAVKLWKTYGTVQRRTFSVRLTGFVTSSILRISMAIK